MEPTQLSRPSGWILVASAKAAHLSSPPRFRVLLPPARKFFSKNPAKIRAGKQMLSLSSA